MRINWYPGHMKKTRESIENSLKMVDLVIEIIDSRIPVSSRNPILDEIIGKKPRLIVMNKIDLSNNDANIMWSEYFRNLGEEVVLVDAKSGQGINNIIKKSNYLINHSKNKLKEKGVKNIPVRAMIIGIPNVGKSTIINSLSSRKGAKVGRKPGVTRSNQWIKTNKGLQLLDTPGILWPKIEDKDVALKLAFIGSIKDEVLDRETLALRLVENIAKNNYNLLKKRYGIEEYDTGLEILDNIALKRGAIRQGKEIDYTRVADIILDEFRKGLLGKITLEYPQEF